MATIVPQGRVREIGVISSQNCHAKNKARLADLGDEVLALTPAEFGKLIADETEKWGNVIRALNIKAE
jgi:hypothetical protein